MDALTQEVYSAEFSKGRLHERLGGATVREARDAVGEFLCAEHGSTVMYEFDTRPVVCRCSSRVFVKILHDQWFLTYSDPAWKDQVKAVLPDISLVPPEVRTEFERTIDWLKDWAATRRVGLGTHLTWDPTWLIEPLSDSTIYMAYYTVAHRIRELDTALLTPAAFDYLFLGIETPESARPGAARTAPRGVPRLVPVRLPVLGQGPDLEPPDLPALPPRGNLPARAPAEGDGRLRHGPPERGQDVVVQGQRLPARGRARRVRGGHGPDVPDGLGRALAGLRLAERVRGLDAAADSIGSRRRSATRSGPAGRRPRSTSGCSAGSAGTSSG